MRVFLGGGSHQAARCEPRCAVQDVEAADQGDERNGDWIVLTDTAGDFVTAMYDNDPLTQ